MTLRLRLTLFYTGILSIALLAFSVILYLLLQNSLMAEVDRVLTSSAVSVEKSLAASATGTTILGVDLVLVDPAPIREFTIPGIYLQILNQRGRILTHSANLGNEIIPISPDAVQDALAGNSTLTTTNPGRPAPPLRVLTTPLELEGGIVGVLQVAASLYHVQLTMRKMLTLLLIGLAGTILVGVAGIWGLSGRALRPLDIIAKTAEYIGSSQDLSQRLQVNNTNDEVGRLVRAFNTMISRLDAAFAAQKQFIADSSHELRTPLTVVRGNLDLIKRDSRPKSRNESLAAIEQETIRMGKIVDDLMLLAQLDAVQAPQCHPVALEEVVLHVYNQARVMATDKQVTLGHIDAVVVMADHDRLVQMLLNLVDNAVKYTPAGGTITIACHAPNQASHPGLARLSVQDTGVGIAAQDIPHIFDRFYRVDKGRSRAQGGTGLGLAIVKSIAETYGGHVHVESTVGQGSTFTVFLPVAQGG